MNSLINFFNSYGLVFLGLIVAALIGAVGGLIAWLWGRFGVWLGWFGEGWAPLGACVGWGTLVFFFLGVVFLFIMVRILPGPQG